MCETPGADYLKRISADDSRLPIPAKDGEGSEDNVDDSFAARCITVQRETAFLVYRLRRDSR